VTAVHYDAVEPTCTEDGNLEYWYDPETKTVYLDEGCTEEAALADVTVHNRGHHFGANVDWRLNADRTEATFKATCHDCGEVIDETVPTAHKHVESTYTVSGRDAYVAYVDVAGRIYSCTFNNQLDSLPTEYPVIFKNYSHDGVIDLEWTAVEGASRYALALFVNGKWKVVSECRTEQCTVKDLTAGKEYKAVVAAKVGKEWKVNTSNVSSIPAKPGTTFPVVVALFDRNDFILRWSPVNKAEGYVIAHQAGGKWKVLTTVSASTKEFTYKKMPAGTYKIAVAAKVNGKIETANLDKSTVKVTVE
jgi:hypothetical protein